MAQRMLSISILVASGLFACVSNAATDSFGAAGNNPSGPVADNEVRTRTGTGAATGDSADASAGDVGTRSGVSADASGSGDASASDNGDSTTAGGVDAY